MNNPGHPMHRIKTIARFFYIMAVLWIASMAFNAFAAEKRYKIAILNSSNSHMYSQVISTIQKTIIKKLPASFNVHYVTALEPSSKKMIEESDLLITIGQRALFSTPQLNRRGPILSSLIPRHSYEKFRRSSGPTNNYMHAIYIDPPPEKQILLAKLLLGSTRRYGILLGKDSNTNDVKLLLKKYQLLANIEYVDHNDNIIRKLSNVLQESDVLIALPDPLIFNKNNARDILLTTYRRHIPVIGFSASYVHAGALAAVFSTPQQIARQTGEEVIQWLETPSRFDIKETYPKYLDISINDNVAYSLGISVPPKKLIKNQLLNDSVNK